MFSHVKLVSSNNLQIVSLPIPYRAAHRGGSFYFGEVIVMKIEDHLSDNTKKAIRRRKKKKEKLSFKDIENLMGVHRDRYERRGGAIRNK